MTPFHASPIIVLLGLATSGIALADPKPVEVHASGDCPSGEAVTAELERIAVTHERATSALGRADIFETSHGVRVRLGDSSDATGGERAIETGNDCHERAIAAAVVIASWLTELRSEVRLDLETSTPSWFPSASIAGLGVASGIARWGLGAELNLQLAHRSGWGGRLAAWGTSYRSSALAVNPGQASWTRWVLGLGPVYEILRSRWYVTVAVQLVMARFVVRGEDLAITRQDVAVDIGARLGIDAGLCLGATTPYVGIAAIAWPRSHRIRVSGVDDERTLPKLDVLLIAGLRWGRRR